MENKPKRVPAAEIPTDATCWADEGGLAVAALGGKAWVVVPAGVIPGFAPPLTGEEPWVRRVTKEEVFRLAAAVSAAA